MIAKKVCHQKSPYRCEKYVLHKELHKAKKANDQLAINKIVEILTGDKPSGMTHLNVTALHEAAAEGNMEMVKSSLQLVYRV